MVKLGAATYVKYRRYGWRAARYPSGAHGHRQIPTSTGAGEAGANIKSSIWGRGPTWHGSSCSCSVFARTEKLDGSATSSPSDDHARTPYTVSSGPTDTSRRQ